MPSYKISELNNASALSGAELTVLVQPVNVPRSNKKVTVQTIANLAPVTSINGQTGIVNLVAADVGALAPGANISLLNNDIGYIAPGNQPAHYVYIGPESGPNASPGFRALVASDIPALPYLTANQTITLTGEVTGSGATSISTTIANNSVSNAKLRDSAGLSVIGKATTGSGDPADIVAANDGEILRRSGTSLAFGTIPITSVTMATARLLGRTTASSGAVEEISVSNGVTLSGGVLRLGGALTQSTQINSTTADKSLNISIGALGVTNRAALSIAADASASNTNIGFTAQVPGGATVSSFTAYANGNIQMGNQTNQILGFDSNGIYVTLGTNATGDIYTRSSTGNIGRIAPGTNTHILTMVGGVPTWAAPASTSGTVTSFSSGNLAPLFTTNVATATATPALSYTLTNANPNLVFAGPASGAAGAPSYRSLVQRDMPRDSRTESGTGGSYTVQESDIGMLLYIPTTLSVILPNGLSNNFEVAIFRANNSGLVTITAQTALFTINGENTLAYDNSFAVFTHRGSNIWYGAGTLGATVLNGTVTSVSVGSLSPLFTASVGSATTTPNITFSQVNQSANLVFAGPVVSSGAPTFRKLVDSDLPNFTITPSGLASYTIGESDNMRVIDLSNPGGANVNLNTSVSIGWSTLIWRSATSGPITFVPGIGVTFEGAGTVMEFAKTSVMLVYVGGGRFIAAGAIGDFGGGNDGGGHTIQYNGTGLLNQVNLNFRNGLTATNSAPTSASIVEWDGPLHKSTTISGAAGAHALIFNQLNAFTASLSNGYLFQLNSSNAITTVANSSISIASNNNILLSYNSGNKLIRLDNTGTRIDVVGGGSDTAFSMYYRTASGILGQISPGADGSYLRGAGGAAAPTFSTLILPNTASSGSILYASSANTIGALAAAATGNVLLSGTSPSWGKVGLTTHVSGQLPVASGGTGLSTLGSANQILAMNNAGTALEYKTASNGITSASGTLKLGGPLTDHTTVSGDFVLTLNNQRLITKTSSNNVGAAALQTYSSTDVLLFGVEDTGVVRFGTSLIGPVFVRHGGTQTHASGSADNTTGNLAIITGISAPGYTASGARFLFSANNPSISNGATVAVLSVAIQPNQSSGTSTLKVLNVEPTYNLTGTAAGSVIGIDYNPSVNTLANATHYGLLIRSGNSGFGTAAPTARVHVAAGTATLAPLKLTTGTALTTPADGSLEYHSSHLYFTIGSTRYQLDQQDGDGGGGTVTSITLTQPAAGLTITSSGTPITTSGTRTFGLANDLAALEGLGSTGFAVRTTTDTWAQRSIAVGTGLSISNGNGVSGNPTLSLSHLGIQNLTAPAGDRILFYDLDQAASGWLTVGSGLSLTGTTLTATGGGGGTVTSVTLTQPAAGITITSSGTAITTTGTRTFALANDLAALEALASTGIAVRTATDAWAQRTITAGTGISVTNGNGVSGNPTISTNIGSGAAGQVAYWSSASALTSEAGFEYDAALNELAIGTLASGRMVLNAAGLDARASASNMSFYIRSKGTGEIILTSQGAADVLSYDPVAHVLNAQRTAAGSVGTFTIRAGITGALTPNPHGDNLSLIGGTAYSISGNGNGGSILIQSGQKRAAGSGADGNITINTLTGYLIISNIPTSAAGLPSGAIWVNGNVLTRVP